MPADQKRWDFNASLAQRCNKLKPSHKGHILIDDQALKVFQIARPQQLLGIGVGPDRKSIDLKGEFEGISNGGVVFNDGNDRM
jgi:hypothetical protein